MKKIIIFLISILLITGCGSKTNAKTLEDELTTMGNDYYSKYMKGNNLDVAVVSLVELREANESVGESYDLSKFKDCEETTSVKIYLKSGTTQIEKYEFEINCKK